MKNTTTTNNSKQLNDKIVALEKNISELKKSESLHNYAIHNAPIGIITLSNDGKFKTANKSFCQICGYTEKELLSKNISEMTHEDDLQIGQNVMEELVSGKKDVASFDKRYIHKNGSPIFAQVSTVLAKDDNGKPVHFFSQIIDKTEEIRTYEKLRNSEEQLRLIAENTSDNISITTFDLKAKYIYVSASIKYLTGYEPDELVGRSFFDFIHPKDKKALYPLLKKYISLKVKKLLTGKVNPVTERIQFRFKKKTGDWLYMESTVNIAGDQLISIARDITDYKQFEEEIRASEEKFRTVTENAPIGIYYNNLKGEFLYGNKYAEEIIGFKSDELIGRNFLKLKLLNPKDIIKATKLLSLNKLGKSTGPDNFTLNRKDDEQREVEICTEIITLNEKKVVLGMVQDITERRNVEDQLYRFGRIIRDSLNEIFVFDAETLKFTYVNKGAQQNLGFSQKELLNMTPLDIKPKFTQEQFEQMLAPLRSGEKNIIVFKTEHKRKNKSIYDVEVHLQLYQHGKDCLFFAIILDITERKLAEEKLQISETRFKNAFQHSAIGMALVSTEGNWLSVNDHVCKILGFSREELLKKTFQDITHPDDLDNDLKNAKKMLAGEITNYRMEKRYIHKNGKTVYVNLAVSLVKDEHGIPMYFVSQIQDITKRKQIEIKNRQHTENIELINNLNTAANLGKDLKELLRLFVDGTNQIYNSNGATVYLLSEDGEYLEMQNLSNTPDVVKQIEKLIKTRIPKINIPLKENGIFQELLSSNKPVLMDEAKNIQAWTQEFIKTTFLPEKMRPVIRKLIPQIIKIIGIKSIIIVPLKSAGKTIGLMDVSSKQNYNKNDLQRIANLAEQMTVIINQMQSHNTLMDREQKLSEAQNIAQMGHYSFDVNSGTWTNSDQLDNIFGIDKDFERDIKGWQDIVHPDYKEIMLNYLQNDILKKHQKFDKEYKIVDKKTKQEKWVHGLGNLKFDKNNVTEMFGIIRDITIQKQAEQENKKLISLVENSSDYISIAALDGKIMYINEAGQKLIGMNGQEDYKSLKIFDVAFEEDLTMVNETILKSMKQTGQWAGEIRFKHQKTGKAVHMSMNYFNIIDSKTNKPIALATVSRDITKTKIAEAELRKHKEQLEIMVEERTKELKEKNKLLDDSMKVFVGREQTIYRLQDRIKKLEAELAAVKS